MKKKRIAIGAALIVTALISGGTLNAQTDTTRNTYKEYDTVKVENRMLTPPPTPTPTVATVTPAPQPEKTTPDLRRFEIGARYMPTFTQLTLNTYNGSTVSGTATVSHGYGGFIAFNFSRNIGIQGEVDYNELSQKYKDAGLDRTVKINYVNVPILLSLNTNKTMPVNFNIVVGPQFGWNVGSSLSGSDNRNGTQTLRATVAAKPGDVGLAYGAGFEFALDQQHHIRLDLGFRGMYGLVDINEKNVAPDTYNVLISGSRKTYAAYGGLTAVF